MSLANKIIKLSLKNSTQVVAILLIVLLSIAKLIVPRQLNTKPLSTILLAQNGDLLSAQIATDGQWRFPARTEVPKKFKICLLQFEDAYFYYHLGINPISIGRAMKQNSSANKVKSGASTLTMQTVRLWRGNKKRTYKEKILEAAYAIAFEIKFTKSELLNFYTNMAPYGGNVVGLDAASWRYFGRKAAELSWAETATLAILPNSPSLIYPGKNHLILIKKRNRLLKKLKDKAIITDTDYQLAITEPLPEKPYPLPQMANHLLQRIKKQYKEESVIYSTIDIDLQQKVNDFVERHHQSLKTNEIHNACAIVIDIKTGNVLAYTGNTKGTQKNDHGSDVDIINAPRSTGSILKPFLYAYMLSDGDLLPTMLVDDIPTEYDGYSPKNFNLNYDGVVPANKAIARSLNVPAVRLLHKYGIDKFHYRLKQLGLTTLTKSPSHYGLSLILGGAEATLWDLCQAYCNMGRSLNNDAYTDINCIVNSKPSQLIKSTYKLPDKASVYLTFEAMKEVARPDEEGNWKLFSSSKQIAWKTGTSFGFRDGWAIGLNKNTVIGVWVGNADGEGRPGLTGIETAAPILFDIFSVLPNNKWFTPPNKDFTTIEICAKSGYKFGPNCDISKKIKVPVSAINASACPYHQLIHLDNTGLWRVNSNCESVNNMLNQKWFVLPPVQEYFYRSKDATYKILPALRSDCSGDVKTGVMDFIYPKSFVKLYLPTELNGEKGKIVFKVTHRNNSATIFWHLDGKFIEQTNKMHQVALQPSNGKHYITIVDDKGESITRAFEVFDNKSK